MHRYQWGSQQPPFVNNMWVAIGLWTNIIVLCMSWFCASIIIYVSTNLLDMVLNAVAILFMITLDDEMVTFSDYNNIRTIFVNYAQPQNPATLIFDTLGNCLLRVQCLWSFRNGIILNVLITPVVILVPFIVFACYSASDLDLSTTTP